MVVLKGCKMLLILQLFFLNQYIKNVYLPTYIKSILLFFNNMQSTVVLNLFLWLKRKNWNIFFSTTRRQGSGVEVEWREAAEWAVFRRNWKGLDPAPTLSAPSSPSTVFQCDIYLQFSLAKRNLRKQIQLNQEEYLVKY